MTEPDGSETPQPDEQPARPSAVRRGLWTVVAVLAVTALLLTSRDQLPAAPVLVVIIVAMGAGLWWLADRGGRHRGRPVAGPLEALGLLGAVFLAIVVFWVVFGMLE